MFSIQKFVQPAVSAMYMVGPCRHHDEINFTADTLVFVFG